MQRTQMVMAFLFGAVVALGAALVVTVGHSSLPEAYAQNSGNNEMLMTIASDTANQNNTVFVVDSKNMRLAAYKFNGGHLSLAAVRQITYDMKVVDYAGGGPNLSVNDVQKEAQKNDAGGKK